MTTHTNQDENDGADFEKKASLNAKRKRKSIRALAKTKAMEKSRVWKQPTTTWSAEKTTGVDDRQIIKAVKMNPKRRICKITNNFQKAGVMLWQSTVLRRCWQNYRWYTVRWKPLTSTKNRKARLEFARKLRQESFWNSVYGLMRQRWVLYLSDGKAKMWRKKGNCKWSQAYSLICKAWWWWCHRIDMYGCLWNRPSQL